MMLSVRGMRRRLSTGRSVSSIARCATRGDADTNVLRKVKDKWLGQMCSRRRDTAFFVGNQFKNPDGFLVLGVFWPRRG